MDKTKTIRELVTDHSLPWNLDYEYDIFEVDSETVEIRIRQGMFPNPDILNSLADAMRKEGFSAYCYVNDTLLINKTSPASNNIKVSVQWAETKIKTPYKGHPNSDEFGILAAGPLYRGPSNNEPCRAVLRQPPAVNYYVVATQVIFDGEGFARNPTFIDILYPGSWGQALQFWIERCQYLELSHNNDGKTNASYRQASTHFSY